MVIRKMLVGLAFLLCGCESLQTSSLTPGLQADTNRGVLSFSGMLDPVLPSIVRVGTLKAQDGAASRLAGIGSGAVLSLIHI